MKKIAKNVNFCNFCKKLSVNKTDYSIYRIGFVTNKGSYNVGILNIEDGLSRFLFEKGIRLSYTQVVLLRPDILLEYLKLKYNNGKEKVLNSFLYEAKICNICFDKYKLEIPIR